MLLDAQELIVFGGAIRAGQRTGLDLTAIGRDSEIGDGRVFRFARSMRHHRAKSSLVRHIDGGKRFRQRADLFDLEEDGVGRVLLDAAGLTLDIGDEKVVADELAAPA